MYVAEQHTNYVTLMSPFTNERRVDKYAHFLSNYSILSSGKGKGKGKRGFV